MNNVLTRFAVVVFSFVCSGFSFSTTFAEAPRPNILLIVVDDLGWGDLGCYGASDIQSPKIDALIAGGMKYTNAYANCPVCSPTRASLLTGRYPELVGVPGVIRTHRPNNWGHLSKEALLLPSVLKTGKYKTAIIGKWHLGLEAPNRPNDRGFDFFQGFLGDMMDDYYHHRRHQINYMRKNEVEINPKGHATDLFTQWACQFLRDESKSESPFFLYLAYNAPHTPIQPPKDWISKVQQRESGIGEKRAKLVALIEHMDQGIGEVLKTLEETGQANNTLVVFVSDNGGQLNVAANNGQLRDGKQSMYEGGIRVPMGIRWPGQIKPGTISAAEAASIDVFPTLCDAAAIEISSPVDGVSLLPLFSGKWTQIPQRDLFFHRREGGDRYGGMITNAIIRDQWKLVRNTPFSPLELYNLKNDPREEHDLSKQNRAKFRELSVALRAHIQRGGSIPWQKPD